MTEDVELIFASSHTHERARNFEIRRFDGKKVEDKPFYTNPYWEDPQLMNFDPPMKVKKGEGFEFRCYYDNPTENIVNWGFSAKEEMCQIGIVFTPGDTSIKCTVVETSDGKIVE